MTDEQRKAYRETNYWVDLPGQRICIRVGEANAELDALLAREGAARWAYVTAWNPRSITLDRKANERRQRRLVASLRGLGLRSFHGVGEARDGSWSEPSLLVLGVSQAGAKEIGRALLQNAIVVGERGGTAELAFPLE